MKDSTFPWTLRIHYRFLGSNFMTPLPQRRIWGSHRAAVEDSSLLGCYTVSTGKQLLTCHGTLLPSSLGSSRPTLRSTKPNLWSSRPPLGSMRPNLGSSRPSLGLGKHNSVSCRPTLGWSRPNLGVPYVNFTVRKANCRVKQAKFKVKKANLS